MEVEHVRSFNAIMCGATRMPMLLSFKVLRVLVIENCDFPEGRSLEDLGKLVQLRYLGLVKTSVTKLPKEIGHDLKFLEILDIRGGSIHELPPSVGELRNLRCLWADKGTEMKGEIGKLTCLEELQLHSVEKCPTFCRDVGKLTKVRVLEIYFDEMEETVGKALVESLCNLHKIHGLKVLSDDDEYSPAPVLGGSLEDLAPCPNLRSFRFSITIPRVPSWINYLCVPLLSCLWLPVEVVEARDLQTLGRLPSLLCLILESKEEKCISYTFGSDEFHKLICLMTNIEITIGEGALPMLETLGYRASAQRKDVASLVPWNNRCPLLQEVTCYLDCANCGNSEVEQVKEELRYAVKDSPNGRQLNIKRENYDWEAGKFIDKLEWIIHGLEDFSADKRDICVMITSLETLLRDAAEPHVGRYGEQDIRGFVSMFRSWLHDAANNDVATSSGGHQEEAGQY